MIEVHTRELDARSGKPLICLCMRGVSFARRHLALRQFAADAAA